MMMTPVTSQDYNIIVCNRQEVQQMDWNKERNSLREGGNLWKPTPGMCEVEFVDDGTENSFEWEGETIQKVRFKIKINKSSDIKEWNITKGETKGSLYGQLAVVGATMGTLVGHKIHLLVMGKGKETKYTVQEAVLLMNQEEKSKEEVIG